LTRDDRRLTIRALEAPLTRAVLGEVAVGLVHWFACYIAVATVLSHPAITATNGAPPPPAAPKAVPTPHDADPHAPPQQNELRGWRDGWFRLEGAPLAAWDSGHQQRFGDYGVRFTAEYEVPVTKHMTVGPRTMPFMYWNENRDGDSNIFAFGLGVALRGYFKPDEYRGFYGEAGAMIIAQSAEFAGNTGHFNSMEEIGAGFLFNSNWSIAVKAGHISNAELAYRNAGVNWASLSLGYSFRH
jgi:hypothetical protein